MLQVSSGVGGEDQDVVKVCKDGDVKEVVEEVVDDGLEGGQCVCQAKGQDKSLKVAISCMKRHLPLVPLSDLDQVVGPSDVKLGEDLSSAQVVEQV